MRKRVPVTLMCTVATFHHCVTIGVVLLRNASMVEESPSSKASFVTPADTILCLRSILVTFCNIPKFFTEC